MALIRSSFPETEKKKFLKSPTNILTWHSCQKETPAGQKWLHIKFYLYSLAPQSLINDMGEENIKGYFFLENAPLNYFFPGQDSTVDISSNL